MPTPIPSQVANALVGQQFSSFGDLRAAVWKSVGTNLELNSGFSPSNVGNMQAGYAPIVPKAFQVNTSYAGMRFNLDHITPISKGGAVYDLSNLRIVSPLVHTGLH